jgi:hypothetical protein
MDVFCVSFDIEKSRIASETELPCVLLKLHEFQRVNPHRISDGFTLSCSSAQGKNLKIPAGHQTEKSNENHWGFNGTARRKWQQWVRFIWTYAWNWVCSSLQYVEANTDCCSWQGDGKRSWIIGAASPGAGS